MDFLPRNKKERPHSTRLRSEMMPQERRLWYDFLRTASPRWNRQRIIDSYIVDFFCLKAKLVVELDGSQHYDENGLVEYNADKCAACYMCVMNCRYGIPAITPDRKRVIKCDFCQHLEEGPACVRACPKKAIEVREV